MNFNFPSAKLLAWYDGYQRDLPWRKTKNPYFIWLSEIILQQTQVKQGESYYQKFTKNYPNLTILAQSSEAQILKDWEGLGYYSRARNLHATAIYLYKHKNSVFPNNFSELLTLKGIGPYTAAAIASIAFNEAVAAVDGNVYRVLSRFYADDTPINETQGIKKFKNYAEKNLDQQRPGDFNQAMMELGAMICTPKNPQCESCPLVESCQAFRKKIPTQFPVKVKKLKVVDRFFHFLILQDAQYFYIEQRQQADIWQGLFSFPNLNNFEKMPEFQDFNLEILSEKKQNLNQFSIIKHLLTHQRLYIQFTEINFEILSEKKKEKNWLKIAKKDYQNYAFPKPLQNFLKHQIGD